MNTDKFIIRDAAIDDATALLSIYSPYVEKTAVTFEYDVLSAEEFAQRIQTISARYPYLVLVQNDSGNKVNDDKVVCNKKIVGYGYASTFKDRAAYDRCVETSIYIRQGEHGKGFGRALYQELEKRLKNQGILNSYACIAYAKPGNTHLDNGSFLFHQRMGYSLVGTFHDCGYKFGQWYDMVWMEKMLGNHEK